MEADVNRSACCFCSKPIDRTNEPGGVIYVRHMINTRWVSAPCCTGCWDANNPGRIPHRMLWEPREA